MSTLQEVMTNINLTDQQKHVVKCRYIKKLTYQQVRSSYKKSISLKMWAEILSAAEIELDKFYCSHIYPFVAHSSLQSSTKWEDMQIWLSKLDSINLTDCINYHNEKTEDSFMSTRISQLKISDYMQKLLMRNHMFLVEHIWKCGQARLLKILSSDKAQFLTVQNALGFRGLNIPL